MFVNLIILGMHFILKRILQVEQFGCFMGFPFFSFSYIFSFMVLYFSFSFTLTKAEY